MFAEVGSIGGGVPSEDNMAAGGEVADPGVEMKEDIPNGSDVEWFNAGDANGLLLFSIAIMGDGLAASRGGRAGGGGAKAWGVGVVGLEAVVTGAATRGALAT